MTYVHRNWSNSQSIIVLVYSDICNLFIITLSLLDLVSYITCYTALSIPKIFHHYSRLSKASLEQIIDHIDSIII